MVLLAEGVDEVRRGGFVGENADGVGFVESVGMRGGQKEEEGQKRNHFKYLKYNELGVGSVRQADSSRGDAARLDALHGILREAAAPAQS